MDIKTQYTLTYFIDVHRDSTRGIIYAFTIDVYIDVFDEL